MTKEEEGEALLKFLLCCYKYTPDYTAWKATTNHRYRLRVQLSSSAGESGMVMLVDYGSVLGIPTFISSKEEKEILVYFNHFHEFLEYVR